MWLYTLTITYHADDPRGQLRITNVDRPDGPTVTRALCVIVVGVAKEGWVLIFFARDGCGMRCLGPEVVHGVTRR